MSSEEKLKTVGRKLILLTRMRFGNKADPLKNVDYLSREIGLDTSVAISAICAAMDD